VFLAVIGWRAGRRDATRHRTADAPRHLHHLGVKRPVGLQPPVPSGHPVVYPARLAVQFIAGPVEPVLAVRPGQAAVPAGRVPSMVALSGVPPVLPVGRVPPGLAVRISFGPPVLPVGPACPIRLTGTVGARSQVGEHVFAGGPGNGFLPGQGRIEPGHEVAPCRVLVALSALRVIPVRHVPTAAYRSLLSTIAVPGPVPGG